jgi:preprotein translocase subunit YajC
VAFLIIIVVMFVVMYFLAIRPQQKRQRAAQDLLSRVAPGDEIVTVGGIYGDVIEVHDDRVVLEIAEDIQIEVARRAVAQIIAPEVEGSAEALHELEVATETISNGGSPEPVTEPKRWGGFGKRSG